MHRPWPRLVAAIVVMGLAALVIGSLWVRWTYGVFWIGSTPTHIALCDQGYTRFDDAIRTRSAVAATDPEAATAIILRPSIGRIPLDIATPARFRPGAGYQGCGHLLLLQVERDGYAMFYKLGSP